MDLEYKSIPWVPSDFSKDNLKMKHHADIKMCVCIYVEIQVDVAFSPFKFIEHSNKVKIL